MATELAPYIFFYGRCEEALEFYKGIFGGSYEMMRVGDSPDAAEMLPGAGKSIMHASFRADSITFMASDGRDVKSVDPEAGNVSIGLTFDDAAKGEKVFAGLSAGGDVKMPVGPAFWGGRFGNVVDKFGTDWLVSLP